MPAAHQHVDEFADSDLPSVRLVPWSPATPVTPPEAGIGERLKYARSELSLSVEALARLCKSYDSNEGKGVSASSLLRYESGDSLPGARELRLLCEALQVPIQWLLLGTLPTGGSSAAQQMLLTSLADYVRETLGDIQLGNARESQIRQVGKQLERAGRLQDARKPPGT